MSARRSIPPVIMRVVVACVVGVCPAAAQSGLAITRTEDLRALGVEGRVEGIALSPDQRYAALTATGDDAKRLYVIDLATTRVVRVDPREAIAGYAEWTRSPLALVYRVVDEDARWRPADPRGVQTLAFVGNGVEGQSDVFLYEPAAGAVTRVTATADNEALPRWSQDGLTLTYVVRGKETEVEGFTNFSSRIKQMEGLRLQTRGALPPLTALMAGEVFQRPVKYHRSATRITDIVLEGDDIVYLGGMYADASDARLMKVDEGGRARAIVACRGATRLLPMPGGAGVCVLRGGRADRSALYRSEIVSTASTRGGATPSEASMFDGRFTAMPVPIGRGSLATAAIEDGALVITTSAGAKGRGASRVAATLAAPLVDDGGAFTLAAFDAVPRQSAADASDNVVAVAASDSAAWLVTGRWIVAGGGVDDIDRASMSLYGGFNGFFTRYTGDYAPGIFMPAGGVFLEGRPTTGMLRRFAFGAKFSYSPVSASPADKPGFSSHLWHAVLYARYEWPMWYDISPHVGLGVGKVLFNNKKYGSGAAIKPTVFELSAGVMFDITPTVRIDAFTAYSILSTDIDGMKPDKKNDSFAVVGAGFHYLLPL